MTSKLTRVFAATLGCALASSSAFALPYDTDMANSDAIKAYERPFVGLPEGVVAQAHILTPQAYAANFSKYTKEGDALENPVPFGQEALAQGEKMFGIYCTPCHGDGETNGPVGSLDPEGKVRFGGVAQLSGKLGIAKKRSDGYLYLTIRNGGPIMPYYSWAMTNDEMWSIVHYVRTLPDSAAPVPEPEQPEAAEVAQ